MDKMHVVIKQEPQEFEETPELAEDVTNTTVSPAEAVQSAPEGTVISQGPVSVTTSAQGDTSLWTPPVSGVKQMTSAVQSWSLTSSLTTSPLTSTLLPTTSSSTTLPVASIPQTPAVVPPVLTDKPRNFKLQIDQHGGLRLTPPTSSSQAVVESRKDISSGDPLFFINRTADGQSQLYTSFPKEPGQFYILRPSSGQELSIIVDPPGKPAPKQTITAPNVHAVLQPAEMMLQPALGQTSSQGTRKTSQTAAARQVLVLPGQTKTSLLRTANRQKPDVLKVRLNTKSAAPCSTDNFHKVVTNRAPERPSFGLPLVSQSQSHDTSHCVTREKGKRRQTARKSFVRHKKMKLTSCVKSDILNSNLSWNTEVSSGSTVREGGGFQDVHNFPFKIDSVFSLAGCEEVPSDMTWEEQEGKLDEKKAVKVENLHQACAFTQAELEDMCGSSFVVLESLDKTVIDNRGHLETKSKCSHHCRKRTLMYLCMLDLIVCHDKKKKRLEWEREEGTSSRKTTISKEEPLPSADAGHTLDHSASLSKVEQQNGFTNLLAFPEHSVSTKVNTSAVSQLEVAHKSAGSHGADTSHTSVSSDSLITSVPCTTTLASSVTTDGRWSLKAVFAEPLLKIKTPSVTTASSASVKTNEVPIPSAFPFHEPVVSSASTVSLLCDISKRFKETCKESTLDQENQSAEVDIVCRENSVSESSSASEMASFQEAENSLPRDALAQIVSTTSCQSSDASSSIGSTKNANNTACASGKPSNPTLSLSPESDSQPSLNIKQIPSLSPAVPRMVTAQKTTSTLQTTTTKQTSVTVPSPIVSQNMQLILKLMTVANSTKPAQRALPLTYSMAKTASGSSLSSSVGQLPVPSCTKGVTYNTNVPVVSTTANAAPPIPILPKASFIPLLIPPNSVQIKVPTSTTVPSQPVSIGTSLHACKTIQPEDIEAVYILKDGTVMPVSTCKLQSTPALKASGAGALSGKVATSAMQSSSLSSSGQQTHNQPEKVSLIRSSDKLSSPLLMGSGSAMPLKPVGQAVSAVSRPLRQGSKMESVSAAGNAAHSSPVTFIINKAAPVRANRPVSSPFIRLPPNTAFIPSGIRVSSLLKKLRSSQGEAAKRPPTDTQIVQASCTSKATPNTADSTITSRKSIDVTPSTKTKTGPSSALQQISKSSTRVIKVVPAPCMKTKQAASYVVINSPSTTKVPSHIGAKVTEPRTIVVGPTATSLPSISSSNTELPGSVPLSVSESVSGSGSVAAGRRQPYLQIFTPASAAAMFTNTPGITSKENDKQTSQSTVSSSCANSVSLSVPQSTVMTTTVHYQAECSSTSTVAKLPDKENEYRPRKRARLEEKYPLPPGVHIKREPLTFGYPTDTTAMSSQHSFSDHNDLASASLSDSVLRSSAKELHPPNPDSTCNVSATDTTSQPAALSDSGFVCSPVEFESAEPPVGFQLCDPDTDSDSENPPADLDCADLDSSGCQPDRVVYEDPPVLTPMIALQSYKGGTDNSLTFTTEGASFSGRVPEKETPVSSNSKSAKSRSRTKRSKAARKTAHSSFVSGSVKKIGTGVASQRMSFSGDDDYETDLLSASQGLLSPPSTSSLTSLPSSVRCPCSPSSSEVGDVSSGSGFDRIRKLKEMLKQQNEHLEQIRHQRALQGPLMLNDD